MSPPVPMSGDKSAAAMNLTPALPDDDVVRLVARFYEINLTDPLLTHYFTQSKMTALRAKFARFVVHGLAGLPMDRPRLRRIHCRLGIGDIEFAACAKNLLTALSEQPQLESKLKDQLLLLLWELESDIVVEDGVPMLDDNVAIDGSLTRTSNRQTASTTSYSRHKSSMYSSHELESITDTSFSANHTSSDVIYLDDLQEIAVQRDAVQTAAVTASSNASKPFQKRSGWRSLLPW
ncbi:hypothetical protein BDF22DRAFT_683368 [Syncephalis plumigaleata]|nr:hypothetical protein BDF22DRAFT_683368 [Syncephalis plumigaleata]